MLVLFGVLTFAVSAATVASAHRADDRQSNGLRIQKLLADVSSRTNQTFVALRNKKAAAAGTQERAAEADLAQVQSIARQLDKAVPLWMGGDPAARKLAADAALFERDFKVLHATPVPTKYRDPMDDLHRNMLGLAHGINQPECSAKGTYFPASDGEQPHVHFFWLCKYDVTTIDIDTGGVPVETCTASAGTCQVEGGTRLVVTTHGGTGFIDAVGSGVVDGNAIVDIIPIKGDGSPSIDDITF
jgi:hypothetical protein